MRTLGDECDIEIVDGQDAAAKVTKGSRMPAGFLFGLNTFCQLTSGRIKGRDAAAKASRASRKGALALLGAFFLVFESGCGIQDMVTQPKYETFQPTSFFSDGQSARPIEPGTIARGQLRINPGYDTGAIDGYLVGDIPLKGFDPKIPANPAEAKAIRETTLERGRQRFNIYCSPCHSQTGLGDGIIVQRGFSKPPSLHLDRLRDAPAGHFFHVITNGYGAMYSYASRIQPADRWAIVAYVRALQLSQNAQVADAGMDARIHLQNRIQGAAPPGGGGGDAGPAARPPGGDAPAAKKEGGAESS